MHGLVLLNQQFVRLDEGQQRLVSDVGELKERMGSVETRLDGVEKRLGKIENGIDRILAKLPYGHLSVSCQVLVTTLILGVVFFSACDTQDPPTATPAPDVTAEQLWVEHDSNVAKYELDRVDNWFWVSGIVSDIGDGRVILDGGRGGFTSRAVVLHDLPLEDQAVAVKGRRFTALCKVVNRVWNQIDVYSNRLDVRQCKR